MATRRRNPCFERWLVLVLAGLLGFGSADCDLDDSCPCMAPGGIDFQFDCVPGDTACSNVHVTALRGGTEVLTNADVYEASYLDAGTYDLVFLKGAGELDRLNGVCTPGPGRSGCDCGPAGPTATILIHSDAVELVQQGC